MCFDDAEPHSSGIDGIGKMIAQSIAGNARDVLHIRQAETLQRMIFLCSQCDMLQRQPADTGNLFESRETEFLLLLCKRLGDGKQLRDGIQPAG